MLSATPILFAVFKVNLAKLVAPVALPPLVPGTAIFTSSNQQNQTLKRSKTESSDPVGNKTPNCLLPYPFLIHWQSLQGRYTALFTLAI